MSQRMRDGSAGASSTRLPFEIILPVAASVVFVLVLALVYVHRKLVFRKHRAKCFLHSPSLLVMSDLEANRQWLSGLECLMCLGLGRPKSVCSLGLDLKCRGEGAFHDGDGDVPPPMFHVLPQNVFFPGGRPSPKSSCATYWFQSYGYISPSAKPIFGGKAVPDIRITVPAKAANKATSSFLRNRRWTRAFKHDLGLVDKGIRRLESQTQIVESHTKITSMRIIAPRRRATSAAPRALFNLRLARSAGLPTISEARESCCSSVKGFVAKASMSRIDDDHATAPAGLLSISLPVITSRHRLAYSKSAPNFTSQRALCGGSFAFRNAPTDGTDHLIVDSVVDSAEIEFSAAADDSDSRPSFLPYFDSRSSSIACSRNSGTSDIAYSGCSSMSVSTDAMSTSIVPSTSNCVTVPHKPDLESPSNGSGAGNRGSLNGLAGVELWIDEDVDLFYYAGRE